jgi:hypothetical protein
VVQYLVCGLAVESDLVLPAFSGPSDGSATTPDAIISARSELPEVTGVTHRGPNWTLGPDQYRLKVPGIVDMLVRDGKTIDYQLLGATPADAAAFVASTGLGALLHQRGDVVLHASAVQVGRGAVLFCGPSGAGKSTIAAALVERGFPLVNDDFCAVRMRGDQVLLYPDGRQHKLWEQAVDHLAASDRVGEPIRPALSKFYVAPRLASASGEPLPISAVYALREDRRPDSAAIEALNVVDAARALRRNAYRPMLTRLMGQQQLYFEMSVRLLRQAVVGELVRAMDFASMPLTLDRLEAEWARAGLTRAA